MARPTGWDVLGLDGDPTPGAAESVRALARHFHDLADDAERAGRGVDALAADPAAPARLGTSAEGFSEAFGALPGRLRRLGVSYREASDALAAYAPKLSAAQDKADAALVEARVAFDAVVNAADGADGADGADSADGTYGTDSEAEARLFALAALAHEAYDEGIAAAAECAEAIRRARAEAVQVEEVQVEEVPAEEVPAEEIQPEAPQPVPVDLHGHKGDALLSFGAPGATIHPAGRTLERFEAALLEKLAARGNKAAHQGGDPVDVVSGSVIASETDVALPAILPLALHRSYSSSYRAGRLFGPGWSSTLDQRLAVTASAIRFTGDDAQVLTYPVPEPGGSVLPADGARWPLEWDRETDEIRISDPWLGHTRHFAAVHHRADDGQIRDLTAVTDRNGNRIACLRDEVGTPVGIQHSGGYRLAVETESTASGPRISGLRLLDDSAEDGGVRLVAYRHDERGRLTGVVNSSGLPFAYEYDDEDRITATVNRVGFRYEYEYDEYGRTVRGTGSGGFLSAVFTYDLERNATVVTDSLGRSSMVRYDDAGHPTLFTDALGATTATRYDRHGRILSRSNPLGQHTVYEYDALGDPVRVTAPNGSVTVLSYDAFHQVTAVRTDNGPVWLRTHDDRGNLVEVAEPSGGVSRAEYGAHGGLARTVGPLGAVVAVECDAAGLPVAVTDPRGGTTRAERDAFGRVVAVTDATGATRRFRWTVEGLLAARTDADGVETVWTYDAEGNLTGTVDPLGGATRIDVGPFGRMVARTGPDGVRREFFHDTELNLLAVRIGEAVWHYAYDAADRLVAEADFIGRRLAYRYDPAGRMVARTTGLGEWIGFEYDAVGQLVTRRTPQGVFRYFYDSERRLTGIVGDSSVVRYVWDASGRLVSESVDGRTTAYEYDLAGRRVRRVTPGGAVSEWSYDAGGLPSALRAGDAVVGFGFDGGGREVSRVVPGAGVTSRFDAGGRLVARQVLRSSGSSGEGHLVDRQWSWRADGALVEAHDALRGSQHFETDAVGRVTAVSGRDWQETYAYDAFGGIAREAFRKAGEAESEAEEAPRVVDYAARTRQARNVTFEYDYAGRAVRAVRAVGAVGKAGAVGAVGRALDGERSGRSVRSFAWDSEDRLAQAVTPDGTTWRYTYDPIGRRTSKTRVGADGGAAERTVFVWEGPVLVEQQTRGSDGSVRVLTWDHEPGSARPVAQRLRVLGRGGGGRAEGYGRGAAREAVQAAVEETFHGVLTDVVGTATELLGADGMVAWRLTTDLWGRESGSASGSASESTSASSGAGAVECLLRFPGQYRDAETGLHYNLHRYYDPESATYLTPDPLGLAAGADEYAFGGNPLVDADPSGLVCDRALMTWAQEAERAGAALDPRAVSAAWKTAGIPVPDDVVGWFGERGREGVRFVDEAVGVPVVGGISRRVGWDVCGPFVRDGVGWAGDRVRTFYWVGSMSSTSLSSTSLSSRSMSSGSSSQSSNSRTTG